MPRIADLVLECSVYLYTSPKNACFGKPDDGASGFLVSIPAKRENLPPHIYVVTNNHVIEDHDITVRFRAGVSCKRILKLTSAWHQADDDDLAVNLLAGHERLSKTCHHIPLDLFVSESLIDQLDIGIGDEVFMVGRLIRNEEEPENSPIVRFGHIASPLSCLTSVWGNEVILAEYRTLGKASGSPVFLEISQRQRDLFADQSQGRENLLLGVNRGSTRYKMPIEGIEGATVSIDSSMGMIVPAWRLRQLLESVDVSRERQEIEDAALLAPVLSPSDV
jgi:hypothetical protein